MQKDIDILSFLEKIMMKTTRLYREDFQFDVSKLTAAVQAQDKGDRSFFWMARPCGTWCLNERHVFIQESFEHSAWMIYEREAEKVRAFRVTVTGEDQGRPIGNIYPMDYKAQLPRIKRTALHADNVTLTFLNGRSITFPCEEVKGRQKNIAAQYGSIEQIHYNVKDEQELEALILAEWRQPGPRTRRTKAPPQRAVR